MTKSYNSDGDGGGVLGVVVRDDGDPAGEAVQPAARGDLRVRPQRRHGMEVLLRTGMQTFYLALAILSLIFC